MNFSQLILHEDYNLKAISAMYRKDKTRIIRLKNLKIGDATKLPIPGSKKDKKKEITQHKKPNNNPRLRLIKRTKQLISNKPENLNLESRESWRSKQHGNNTRIRYVSTSLSNRKTNKLPYRLNQSAEFNEDNQVDNLRQSFFGNSFLNIKISIPRQQHKIEVMTMKKAISERRKKVNKSTLEQNKQKVQPETARPSTTNQPKRIRHRPSIQNIEPW